MKLPAPTHAHAFPVSALARLLLHASACYLDNGMTCLSWCFTAITAITAIHSDQIWDTAGMERFKCITSTYYRGAHVAIIVFDMANLSSLSSAVKWLSEVLASNQQAKPLIFLVGTKKELLCQSAFDFVESQAITIAKEISAEYWSLSAKTGDNVDEFFHRVAVLTFEAMIRREINAARIERPPVKYTSKFIRLKRNKSCKKFWSFSCARF